MKLLFASAAALVLMAGASAADQIVFEESGSGSKNTRPFTVEGPWEAQWEHNGSMFVLTPDAGTGSLMDNLSPAMQSEAGVGASYYPETGTYFLSIQATGNWTIRVVEVD